MGAIVVHDAVWVLPSTARTREQFQWLAAEIIETSGDAIMWEATELFIQPADTLRRQFMNQVDSQYQEILAELQQPTADLAALSRRYHEAKSRDYFVSPLGLEVREALIKAREGSDL